MRVWRTVGVVGWALGVLGWSGSEALLQAQPAYRVSRTMQNPGDNGMEWVELGGLFYFTGYDTTRTPGGWGLYVTDGTEAGTTLVLGGITPQFLTAMDGALYFVASQPATGNELWRSDGTPGGTALLLDIRPGATGSDPTGLTVFNDELYFAAHDGTPIGREIWKSDGTPGGTVLVKDTCVSCAANPDDFVVLNASTLMFTSGPFNELWKTDGTANGTVRVGTLAQISELVNVNGTLFFVSTTVPTGYELFKSDGTVAGTVLVKDINPEIPASFPKELTALGSLLIFTANDGTNGEELWRSDGTEGGTTMVQAIAPGQNPGPFHLINAGGTGYFVANSGATGDELWKTDGNTASLVKDINPGAGSSLGFHNADPTQARPSLYVHDCIAFGAQKERCRLMTAVGGDAYFFAFEGTGGAELWKTDGTTGGTVRAQDIYPGLEPSALFGSGLRLAGSRLFLAARGATIPLNNYTNTQLWALSTQPVLIAGDLTVNEGNGAGVANVPVSLLPASGGTVTVEYATANGTALAGTDYTAVSGTLTFSAGTTVLNVAVPLSGDTTAEPNKTFFVNLSNASGAPIAKDVADVVIQNDDGPILNLVDPAPAAEPIDLTFNVTLSSASASTVTVEYRTVNGSATSGADYNAVSGTLTFTPGQTTRPVTVPVNDDTFDEPNETFTLQLFNPSLAVMGDGVGQGTIVDNDSGPIISLVTPITLPEGNTGTSIARFRANLNTASAFPVSADFATQDGTATVANNDYQPLSGVVTFAPGSTEELIDVLVNGDTIDEDNETFFLNLSNPQGGTIGTGTAQATITDGDNAVLLISDASIVEGSGGTTNLEFMVRRTPGTVRIVTVQFATGGGTATAGTDYGTINTLLTFPANPGESDIFVQVPIVTDLLDELNETFNATLSNPTNAQISDPTGVGTIVDDDNPPTISVDDVTVTEGNAGTVNADFTVSLSAPSGQVVRVSRATANQTAIAPGDYTALTSAQLTFNPGSPITQTVTVQVNGDTLGEANETFALNLSGPQNATIADGVGIGTITNDDLPGLSVSNVTVTEGNTGTVNAVFNVTLNPAAPGPVTVQYTTTDGTAVAGADYNAVSGTLTFTAGTTTLPVTVQVVGELLDEANETFTLDLSNASGASLTDPQGLGTITDNDTSTISIANVTVTEGNSGTVNAVLNVTLSVPSAQTVTVSYATADQTATAGTDYLAASGTLTFTSGQTTQPVTVTVNGDTTAEANETFAVNLSNPSGAAILDGLGVGTITDDETDPTISVSDVTVAEGNSGTVTADFTVTLSFASGGTVTVNRATQNLTATAGTDYVALTSAPLSFAPGETTKTVSVTVNGDTTFEPNETFRLNLSGPVGATIVDGQGDATIINDDGTFLYTVQPCRVADTRPSSAVLANTARNFPVTGLCNIPATAKAVVFNVTAVNPGAAGNFRMYPTGAPLPNASVLNFSQGATRANNALVAVGTGGQVTVRFDTATAGTSSHVVIDVSGYFDQ